MQSLPLRTPTGCTKWWDGVENVLSRGMFKVCH